MKVMLVGMYDKTTVSLAPHVLRSYANRFDHIRRGLGDEIMTREFSIFDRPVESAVDEIKRESPDLVGFSTYIWNIREVQEVVRKIGDTKVVLGGPQLTGIEKKIIEKNPGVDFVVSGEGEIVFKELLEHLLGQRNIEEVNGITTRNIQTPQGESVNLDEIPEFYERIFRENRDLTWINLETSRGCPFGCKFCTWGYDKKMRYFNVDRVKRDLDAILQQDEIGSIYFGDSSLLLRKDRAREILGHIIKSGRKISARYEFDA